MQAHNKSGKKERNMGVELLRIVSMLMVATVHILGQGGVLAVVSEKPKSAGYAAAYLLEAAMLSSVNCYALISGYVGAGHPFRYARMIETQLRVWFYTILITAGFCIAMPEICNLTLIKNALFPAMTGQYWYYTAYFGLMLFMPALQCVTAHLSKVQFRNLAVSIVMLFSVFPTLFVSDIFLTAQGYSLLWLAALYLIGAYLKQYGCPFLKKPLHAALVFALCILAVWGIQLAEAWGMNVPLPNMLIFTSPAMLLASVSLLVLFADFRLPTGVKKAVGVCAPLSFGVYLIHVHPLVWKYLFEGRFTVFADKPAFVLVFCVVGTAAGIYAACTLIDAARACLFRACRVRSLSERIEARFDCKK